jgi:uncharacterized membrane protein
MRRFINITATFVGFVIWVSLTSFLLDHFISRPTNPIIQTGIFIFIMLYTLGFIHYIYTRITNKNK